MDIDCFDYDLPKELIANAPTSPRDHSKLLVINRKDGTITDHVFFEIEKYLDKNDVLVLNKTKVFPARFFGKKESGGKIEVLLIEEVKSGVWKTLSKPGLKDGQIIYFGNISFKTIGHDEQTVLLETTTDKIDLLTELDKFGHTPLPPYIKNADPETELRVKYQTVYAEIQGSVAAPTAGFHFTKELLARIKDKGVKIEYITLHVGLGTFAPVKAKKLEDHPMHYEYFEVEKDVLARLNKAKELGKRIVSVGTTTARVLETLAEENNRLKTDAFSGFTKLFIAGSTNLFIYPPYKFKFVNALITNFHLPKSTLLCLVSALVSTPNTQEKFVDFKESLIGKAYAHAIKNSYRFYSFGDACLIL